MSRDVERQLADVWRGQWGRLLALLVAQFRRLDLAEDGLSDAFEAATRHWPTEGLPTNPPAWLLTVARRRILDRLRAEAVAARKQPLLVVESDLQQDAQRSMADAGDRLSDERLRLVFLCAHPALTREAASALTLRLVLGVPAEDVARLFLVSRATMAARLTRARKKLAACGVPLAVPPADRMEERLAVVADVAYLAFTSGYAPGSGPDPVRVGLAGEAIRLVRVLRELLPEPTLDALLALMMLQHSRRDARAEGGWIVLLPDQDRSRWHHDEITAALALLAPLATERRNSYVLQGLIAAEHAVAATPDRTDWGRIAGLYAELEELTRSPVVRLNRAVAAAEAEGPEAGLALVRELDERLPHSHRVPAVRAELLLQLGDAESRAAARAAFDDALAHCDNDAERAHLERRRATT